MGRGRCCSRDRRSRWDLTACIDNGTVLYVVLHEPQPGWLTQLWAPPLRIDPDHEAYLCVALPTGEELAQQALVHVADLSCHGRGIIATFASPPAEASEVQVVLLIGARIALSTRTASGSWQPAVYVKEPA